MFKKKLTPWERGAMSRSGHELQYPSPNDKHNIYLTYAGDIRFGPVYFTMVINGSRMKNRYFGGEIFWSKDSEYFAAQEWLSVDEKKGPHTRLILFRPTNKQEANIAESNGGFLSALRFYPESVTYEEEKSGRRYLANVALEEIKLWQNYE